eukprot:CAMPEP_0172762842 /NCGR_PEP_ID=MMETSP1074-20121228/174279_1 /TAXON_ID=2916 /ORGANISM="Ceratium fusus, Strain PA161109" /LENGTH=147 /DNA_ID=CAMNT_0013597313 /DNA_START=167 /DNA_END=606 /DNA_ORIENTATION=-
MHHNTEGGLDTIGAQTWDLKTAEGAHAPVKLDWEVSFYSSMKIVADPCRLTGTPGKLDKACSKAHGDVIAAPCFKPWIFSYVLEQDGILSMEWQPQAFLALSSTVAHGGCIAATGMYPLKLITLARNAATAVVSTLRNPAAFCSATS